MVSREASHAGLWYTADPKQLYDEIKYYIAKSNIENPGTARFAFGPHAGYRYCGKVLANTYKALNPDLKKLFVIGPSHHVYFKGCVLSTTCDNYETPLGDVKIDSETINELIEYDSKLFRKMNLEIDQDEHSLEMHMPFIKYSLPNVRVVPILISAADDEFLQRVAKAIKPYLDDPHTGVVVSSDFCHWGTRFSYTSYTPTGHLTDLRESVTKGEPGIPIHESIRALDMAGVDVLKSGSYRKWMDYLYITDNTICGAKPLAVLLLLVERGFVFSGYEQSGKVKDPHGSSVSYVSGHAA